MNQKKYSNKSNEEHVLQTKEEKQKQETEKFGDEELKLLAQRIQSILRQD